MANPIGRSERLKRSCLWRDIDNGKKNTTPPRFPLCSQIVKGTICATDSGLIVAGDVNLSNMGLTKIPYKFKEVSGHFDISGNCLATFENCPEIAGSFDCSNNPYLSDDGNRFPEKLTGKGNNLFQAKNNRSLAISLAESIHWMEIRCILKYLNEKNHREVFGKLYEEDLKKLADKLAEENKTEKMTTKHPELEGIF